MRARRLGLLAPVTVVAAAICGLVAADAATGAPGGGQAVAPATAVTRARPAAPSPPRAGPDSLLLPGLGHTVAFPGTDAVGALFVLRQGRPGRHFCTASVVHSRSGDMLITAAHCMTGLSLSGTDGVAFAPGYHDGRFPRGLWIVTSEFVTARWAARHDPNDDVAFLLVHGQASGAPGSLERAVGAERLGLGTPLPAAVEVIGYPNSADRPVSCTALAIAFARGPLSQMTFACGGFSDGTSGGPLLTDVSQGSGAGAVIGVIGGFQQGGDTPDVSYSAEFAANIAALYQRADVPASARRRA